MGRGFESLRAHLWCLWRSWLARQIVALEAESSNLSRHPTKDRTGAFLHGLFFYNGSSPSGKARDFDSRIREFEPRRPNHSSSCMNVQGELLFCRGDHWSPADACGNGKPSGRIWNPPLRRRGRRPRRPGRAAAAARPAGGQWPPLQSPLGPLCEGAPPAGGGGENCTAARNISGYGKVLSLRPFGAPLPLWRKRHLPRIGGVCLAEGGFISPKVM